MTAEVAVLNKKAVALAADSAMTVGAAGKIYPTNKLFAMTKHHPVGVMVYNNAEFMGVPWETIIKMYRESIEANSQATCLDYAQDLVRFICTEPVYKSEQEKENVLRIAWATFKKIRETVDKKLGHLIKIKRRIAPREETKAFRRTIEAQLEELSKKEKSQSMEGANIPAVIATYEQEIDNLIDARFGDLKIYKYIRSLLHRLLAQTLQSTDTPGTHSGVVIAGFGEEEMFPTLAELVTDGVIGGKLKCELRHATDIARQGTHALIKPFAQREMVARFMKGIDPDFFSYLFDSLLRLLYRFGSEVLDANNLADPIRLRAVQEAAEKQVISYSEEADKYCEEQFVDPIMDIVTSLPTEELAGLAEALVNLTSIKRRVSREEETVGGPIDVAVITKGDGFVWIKRKHYFERELNPGYFLRQSRQSHLGEDYAQPTEE